MTKTTRTPRAPRQCEIASDEGYNLAGRPVLLAKLTAYISRPLFAQLATIANAAGGEYSRHNQAFQFPAGAEEARESFAAQARVILANPQPAPDAPATATAADARAYAASRPARAADEQPAPLVISYGRTIISTVTDRTPAGYGPSPAPDAPAPSRPQQPALF